MSNRILPIILIVVAFIGCNKEEDNGTPSNEYLTITLQPSNVKQTMSSFGASDAWSTQFVGKNWPSNKKEQIADWLFSMELDTSGSPIGIGLTNWRFNIGAGSTEQGSSSNISDEWRRAESFMNPDGGFNSQAHLGQRWFLSAAKTRGVPYFTAFVNSPPVALTKNNKAYGAGGSSANLSSSDYSAFSNFLINALTEIKTSDQVDFEHINPFNEPQWDWSDGGQEGSPWKNSEISAFTKNFNAKLENSALSTSIQLPEAAQLNFLYESGGKSGRDNQIQSFFDSSSDFYVGDLNRVAWSIAGHSYYTTWNLDHFVNVRKNLAAKLNEYPGLDFDMSEYCPLENNPEIEGNGRDLGMDLALYGARVIHTDLTEANASSWQWWLAVSPYDYKDGLVYIDYNKFDGNIYDSKMLWALGNYSRFIRPGYQRIGVGRSDLRTTEQTLNGIMVSGFKDPVSGKYVAVCINYSETKIPVNFEIDKLDNASWKVYRTSLESSENIKLVESITSGKPMDVSARSIITLVSE